MSLSTSKSNATEATKMIKRKSINKAKPEQLSVFQKLIYYYYGGNMKFYHLKYEPYMDLYLLTLCKGITSANEHEVITDIYMSGILRKDTIEMEKILTQSDLPDVVKNYYQDQIANIDQEYAISHAENAKKLAEGICVRYRKYRWSRFGDKLSCQRDFYDGTIKINTTDNPIIFDPILLEQLKLEAQKQNLDVEHIQQNLHLGYYSAVMFTPYLKVNTVDKYLNSFLDFDGDSYATSYTKNYDHECDFFHTSIYGQSYNSYKPSYYPSYGGKSLFTPCSFTQSMMNHSCVVEEVD